MEYIYTIAIRAHRAYNDTDCIRSLLADMNECASAPCDLASTECVNYPGAFTCKCKPGFEPSDLPAECRSIGDLGLISGGIPDESITVSGSENGYTKTVRRERQGLLLRSNARFHALTR